MPFGNPIIAGDELIRNAIRSENYVEGGQDSGEGWTIRRDGTAVFTELETRGNAGGPSAAYDNIAANMSFTYKGDELAALLDRNARGVVGFHERVTNSIAAPVNVKAGVMRVNAAMLEGRIYKVTAKGAVYAEAANATINVSLYSTDTGAEPNFFSFVLNVATIHCTTAGYVYPFHLERFVYGNGNPLKLLLSFEGFNVATNYRMYGDQSIPSAVYIEDIGAGTVLPGTGLNDDGAAVPPKTYREFFVGAYDSRSYEGDGSALSAGNGSQYMYSGDIGVDGIRRSACWFDHGTVLGLQNVPLADVVYCDLFFYYDHWYYSNGGFAWIGHHVTAAVTNTQPNAIFATQGQSWEGRDIGKWTSVRNNGFIMDSLRAGAFRGATLGAGNSSSLFDYGYAYGWNGNNPQRPHIRAGYYK